MSKPDETLFVTKDSGKREVAANGFQRDLRTGKGRYDLLPFFALRRDAELYERGAVKYDARNWEKGQPFSRALDSAFRHLAQYMMGDRSEDHLAAARFNVACVMHQEEMIKRGLLPADLNDLPNYAPVLLATSGGSKVPETQCCGQCSGQCSEPRPAEDPVELLTDSQKFNLRAGENLISAKFLWATPPPFALNLGPED